MDTSRLVSSAAPTRHTRSDPSACAEPRHAAIPRTRFRGCTIRSCQFFSNTGEPRTLVPCLTVARAYLRRQEKPGTIFSGLPSRESEQGRAEFLPVPAVGPIELPALMGRTLRAGTMLNYNAQSLSATRNGLEVVLDLNTRSNVLALFGPIPAASRSAHAHPQQQHQRSARPARAERWAAAWPAIAIAQPIAPVRAVSVRTGSATPRPTGAHRTGMRSMNLKHKRMFMFGKSAALPCTVKDRRQRAAWPCDRTRLDAPRT